MIAFATSHDVNPMRLPFGRVAGSGFNFSSRPPFDCVDRTGCCAGGQSSGITAGLAMEKE